MTAPSLFDPQQPQELARVSGRLAAAILWFCRQRLLVGDGTFHASELHAFVERTLQGAPASADRVLRALRQAGQVDYIVRDRRASLYELVAVQPVALPPVAP